MLTKCCICKVSCICNLSVPYSRAYSTVWQAPGSLPAFLAGTNGRPMAWHIYVKNSGTYVGNSYLRKYLSEPSFYIFLSNMADVP